MPTIALLCATRRGYRFIERLSELLPDANLVVCSFREDSSEPAFLQDIRELTLSKGGTFFETKKVDTVPWGRLEERRNIDLMFAVSWRFMIPPKVYNRPRQGTFVFHDSLLPRYRGFAPTVWAIINGEDQTGVTLFEIAEGMDEGDVVAQQSVPIGPDDTIAQVMEHVTAAYLSLLEQNLDGLLSGTVRRFPQDHSQATYTCKRLPEDGMIAWSESTQRVYDLIRGLTMPYSGAYTYQGGRKLRIWGAKRLPGVRPYVGRIPGRVIEIRPGEGSVVLTGNGALLITEVEPEDGTRVCAADILNRLSHTLGR